MKKSTYKVFVLIVAVLLAVSVLCACKKESDKPNSESSDYTSEQDDIEGLEGKAGLEEAEGNTDNKGIDDHEGSSDTDDEDDPNQQGNEGKDLIDVRFDHAAHYGDVEVNEEIIYSEAFEDGSTDFTGRGSAKVDITSDQAYEGLYSLCVSERVQLWNGATINLTDDLIVNNSYVITANLLYMDGPDTSQIDCKVERNGNEYLSFASAITKKGEWTEITGSIIIPEGTVSANVYFETAYSGGDLIDFYVDDISIAKVTTITDRGEIPALKDVYSGLYSMGVAATVSELSPERQELISQQFNSITPGNELKADSVLDYETCISDSKYDDNPAISLKRAEPILEFAQKASIPMRGHTLVWHSQTPRWFFAEGYSDSSNAPLVSRELMLKRMENYIKNVLEYVQTNYPGVIYAWDVVNEAVNTGDGEEGGLRSKDSLWYQVIGPDFIEKAFEYARKYADSDVKLFYNDYNTEDFGKMLAIIELVKGLNEKGLIDGIGLQCHFQVDSPSFVDVDESIRRYFELGLEIHITELDMGMEENTEEEYLRQAKRYKRFFTIINNHKENNVGNITNITFWGLSDDISWLNKPGKPSYPLLFDKYLLQKPAFWAVVLSPDIPLY